MTGQSLVSHHGEEVTGEAGKRRDQLANRQVLDERREKDEFPPGR